jgi:hypothetical protein
VHGGLTRAWPRGALAAQFATLQSDGNFVVYWAQGLSAWATNTPGGKASNTAQLCVQGDGNLVEYRQSGGQFVEWASNTEGASLGQRRPHDWRRRSASWCTGFATIREPIWPAIQSWRIRRLWGLCEVFARPAACLRHAPFGVLLATPQVRARRAGARPDRSGQPSPVRSGRPRPDGRYPAVSASSSAAMAASTVASDGSGDGNHGLRHLCWLPRPSADTRTATIVTLPCGSRDGARSETQSR